MGKVSDTYIRSEEHIVVSPLTGKKVKPPNNSVVCDHLLNCNFLPSFNNLNILALHTFVPIPICTSPMSFSSFHVSLFHLVSLFDFKYSYITLKKKLFPETLTL